MTMGSHPSVAGGQLVAQALHAAMRTVPRELHVHSQHCYFLLPTQVPPRPSRPAQ